MGIGITEEHRELAQAVRGWLARSVPPGEIRKILDADAPTATGARPENPDADAPTTTGVRPGYWEGLAEQGLLGIHLPEEYGGGGGGPLDLAVVLEEAGRAALPGPFLASALASAVLHASAPRTPGTDELLRDLAAGRRIGAVALGPGSLTAVEQEDGHLLDGELPPVLSAAGADLLLLPAASVTGTRWFAVDTATRGLAVRPHRCADPTRPTAEVRAEGVLVPAGRLLPTDSGLVRDLAAVLLAAEACGTAARSLELSLIHI